jgi:hypothetical protein
MLPPKTRRVTGTGSIPAGYKLGRKSAGTGDVELLPDTTTTNAVAGAGALVASISLVQPAAGLTITGGPATFTFALANDLAALEGLSSTGIAVRTTTDTWAQRTITGTANSISVTNGNGVSGNPTLAISTDAALPGVPTAATAAAGTSTTQLATTAFVTAAVAALDAANGMLPLVTGDVTPGNGPFPIADDVGQYIGVPL